MKQTLCVGGYRRQAVALMLGLVQHSMAGTWVQGPLHIIDFHGKHSQLIGEPYTYFNLLSHKHYQLNALLAPVSNRLRMNTVNHLVRPDSTIAELVLMHDEGRVHTNVRMKATHTNSLWTQVDGKYLSPGGFRRGGLLIEPMLRGLENWHPSANNIGPLGQRASVTISNPLFMLWVWTGLGPEGLQKTAPEHDMIQQPCLHWRIMFHDSPDDQMHGLVGRSRQGATKKPLIAHMHALFLTPATWTLYRPREFKESPVGVPMNDEEAHDFVVSGPYAADFRENLYQGRSHIQSDEQRSARMATFFTKKDSWGADWPPEVVETFDG